MISALAVVALRGGSAAIVVAVIAYLVGLGVAIALLDARFEPAPATAPSRTRRPPAAAARAACAAGSLAARAARVGIAISPFFFGYYDAAIWVPVGLALLGVARPG